MILPDPDGSSGNMPRFIHDAVVLPEGIQEEKENLVIHGDSSVLLSELPSDSMDLVFLDPLYYLQLPKKDLIRWKQNNVVVAVRDEWDRFSSFDQYDEFMTSVLNQVKRVLKKTGTLRVI